MRHWLLTNTTYGTWLPGDPRGSVTSVRDFRPGDTGADTRFEHDMPGEPWEDPIDGLYRAATAAMTGPPVYFDAAHAAVVAKQFRETATHRDRDLLALSVMRNHVHVVVGVAGDPDPRKVIADFKAWGSRALNDAFGKPPSGTWWTSKGSKRKLKDAAAVAAAVNYTLRKQYRPLLVWSPAGEPGA